MTVIIKTKNKQRQRGRPVNQTISKTIINEAYKLFIKLGFHAATMEKVAQCAKVSKITIYRHFENKEALFKAVIADRCQRFTKQVLFKNSNGSAEEQLMSAGSSILHTLLSSDIRSLEAIIIADQTNHKPLIKLYYETVTNHIITQIEALLHQLDTNVILNVPNTFQSARLFFAFFTGSNLLTISGFDETNAKDDNEIQSYCQSAVNMFIAAHGGSD
ncbi:TetR/AcrR family transcriptional regulator [Acinetobacter oleivorans]|uniref:TetR/AcrR family transcriptional regulator n=1 Tax=Acinetobacter oleivorans TaxID=1148157 RepID=UPI002B26113F|nr:TetR/AcrR family transcriptional regulator [Acinetobacter oleivorans]WQF74649.1 TetR/AcrR family transcriptional regulator [Acinetobacter oleivorans]